MNMCMEKIAKEVERLRKDVLLRKQLSEKMQNLVDGKGCTRLVEFIDRTYF